MFSETSPRISFSHEVGQADDIVPVEQNESRRDTLLLESNSDFEFITSTSFFQQQSSSADELFANGIILPVHVSLPHPHPHPLPLPLSRPSNENTKKQIAKDQLMVEKPQPKSFWGFKRSSSLNYDVKKSLLCSLLLSRSNSTGSVATTKRASLKESNKQSSQKLQPLMVKFSLTANGYHHHQSQSQAQRPPLKKGYVGSYGNGVNKISSPLLNLNVPPPYISKGTANIFGLGSLLRSGKDKKIKK